MSREERGRLLAAARERKGWTQAELASRCGLTPATISKIESGALSGSVDSILALADELDMDLNSLKRDARPPSTIAETPETERGAA